MDEDGTEYFENAMLQNMFKMLKNLSINYLKQTGGTEVDLLDYQELPLIPTREELVNLENPIQVKYIIKWIDWKPVGCIKAGLFKGNVTLQGIPAGSCTQITGYAHFKIYFFNYCLNRINTVKLE